MGRTKPTTPKRPKKPGITVALTDRELLALKDAGRVPRRLLALLIQQSPDWFVELSDNEARDLLTKKPVLKPPQTARAIIQAFIQQYNAAPDGEFGPVWITEQPPRHNAGARDIGPIWIRDRRPNDSAEVLTMSIDEFWRLQAQSLSQTAVLPPENPQHPDKRPHSLRIALTANEDTTLRELARRMRLEPSVLARLAIVRFASVPSRNPKLNKTE
jgi:hypothetical protein